MLNITKLMQTNRFPSTATELLSHPIKQKAHRENCEQQKSYCLPLSGPTVLPSTAQSLRHLLSSKLPQAMKRGTLVYLHALIPHESLAICQIPNQILMH